MMLHVMWFADKADMSRGDKIGIYYTNKLLR